jgi:uncharacterized protein (TIGR03118 family)
MHDLIMKRIARRYVTRGHRGPKPAPRRARLRIEPLEARLVLSSSTTPTPYLQSNLVSDIQGLAQVTDPSLVNPWGVSFSPSSPFWVSNQHTNTATLYTQTPMGFQKLGLTVKIPTTGSGPQGPTGQVHNGTSSFDLADGKPAVFTFADLNGNIYAWNFDSGTQATREATTSGAVYTGLAIASNAAGDFLYAANDSQGKIDVFDKTFKPFSGFGSSAFVDPKLPSGLVPFNVQFINGNLYVTYAPAGHAAQVSAKPGQGAVAVFTTSGRFLNQLNAQGKLASPWGVALAPAGFGTFSGDLLVGNFAYGDSVINAFDPSNPSTGAFRGTLTDASGHAIENPGLWSLNFGNGVSGDANTLFFSAGINGEADGLFGSLQAIPPLSPRAPIVTNLPNGAFQNPTTIPAMFQSPTTTSANGDLNPYGVAFVPQGFPSGGLLKPGDVLVSNFNNSANLQGTGSSIIDISPSTGESVFFQDTTQSGLTTALGVLKSGFVIVGNLPVTYNPDGSVASIGQGSLRILDHNGNVVETLSDSLFLDGPWDLTVNDQGSTAQVFVSNVLPSLDHNGVVTRIDLTIPKGGDPIVQSLTRIGSGYLTHTDPAALVVGPTGLAYDAKSGTLYVASTGDNEIFAIPNAATRTGNAGTGRVVYKDDAHLRGPLGLVLAPNGDLITSNGDAVNGDPTQPSELVEFTPEGHFVGQFSIDPNQGAAFGLAVSDVGGLLRLAAVEDSTNSLDVWTFQTGDRSSKDHDDGSSGDQSDGSSDNTGDSTVIVPPAPAPGSTGLGTGLSSPNGTSATAPPASSSGGTTPTNGNAAGVDQVFVATHPEDVRSTLSGHRQGIAVHRKRQPVVRHKPVKHHPTPTPSQPTRPSHPQPTQPLQPMPYMPY